MLGATGNFFKDYWKHLLWHLLVAPPYYFLLGTVNGLPWAGGASELLAAVKEKPELLLLAIVLAVVTVWMVSVVRRLLRRLRQAAAYEEILRRTGMRTFRPHATDAERQADWLKCRAEIITEGSLNVLGAGGYETFGSGGALAGFLEEYQGSTRLLLIDPRCENFRTRCRDIEIPEERYARWIYDTIEEARNLFVNKGRSIEIRLYEDMPIWKMIFTENFMWLQHYAPGKAVELTPVYEFQTTKDQRTSLYYPLARVFDRRWRISKPVDLKAWVRPSLGA